MCLRSWRVLLACLLMVVLPIKGIAAAGMAACGPHQSPVHDTAPHSHMQHSMSLHDHAQGAAPEAADHIATQTATDAKCGHCSPCCIAMLLPTKLSLSLEIFPPALVPTQALRHPPSANTARLERPPKNLA